jgi:hypothetical protein
MTEALLEAAGVRRDERPRLGEELPVFCERCGYSLHGSPQLRCESCEILHFACPECGHHQPINTLRPAVQRVLGRLRAVALAAVVFVKLNFFGWLLFAWVAMGMEWSYQYVSQPPRIVSGRVMVNRVAAPREITLELAFAFGLFALPFGMVSRMLLLRWRRGWVVGLVLAVLVVSAVVVGMLFRRLDLTSNASFGPQEAEVPWPFTADWALLLAWTAAWVLAGAMLVWPVWAMLVKVFLPRRAGEALLDWQRSMSAPRGQGACDRAAVRLTRQ